MSKAKFLIATLAAVGLVAVCLVAPVRQGDATSASDSSAHAGRRAGLRTMGVPAVSVNQCSTDNARPSPLCGGDYDCGPFGSCENGGCTCVEGWCHDYSRHCTLPANADGTCPPATDNKGCDMYYVNVNGQCEDIDECSYGISNCEQHCINSPGGFYCGCDEGYSVSWYGWKSTCDDVDECASGNGGCSQTCTNTDGSFECGCSAGFTLNADGKTCDDVDECASSNGGCSQTCTNTDGSFECGCSAGFTLNADGKTCDDVDECATGAHDCGANETCNNEEGSFTCTPPAAGPSTLVTLKYYDNYDLDTGTTLASSLYSYRAPAGTDFYSPYNSQTEYHYRLWNKYGYSKIAYTTMSFESVSHSDIPSVVFCDHINDNKPGCGPSVSDKPLQGAAIVQSTEGRYFKLEFVSEGDYSTGVTWRYSELLP